jgi:hypothetical protein
MKQNNCSMKSVDLQKIKFRFLALLLMNIMAAGLSAAPAADAQRQAI